MQNACASLASGHAWGSGARDRKGGAQRRARTAQVSDQAVRLWQEGWFQEAAEPGGVLALRNPKARPAPPATACCAGACAPLELARPCRLARPAAHAGTGAAARDSSAAAARLVAERWRRCPHMSAQCSRLPRAQSGRALAGCAADGRRRRGGVQEPGAKAPVIVAGKDVAEVDTDYLLLPVSIRDHEGPLGASFPVENRLLPQGAPPPRRTASGRCPPARRAVGVPAPPGGPAAAGCRAPAALGAGCWVASMAAAAPRGSSKACSALHDRAHALCGARETLKAVGARHEARRPAQARRSCGSTCSVARRGRTRSAWRTSTCCSTSPRSLAWRRRRTWARWRTRCTRARPCPRATSSSLTRWRTCDAGGRGRAAARGAGSGVRAVLRLRAAWICRAHRRGACSRLTAASSLSRAGRCVLGGPLT